jgi:ammonium transporter Rh
MADIEPGSTTPLMSPPAHGAEVAKTAWDMGKVFPSVLSAILVALISCFAVFTKYGEVDTDEYYMFYIHVAIMIFVGFGFLMTFLRRYSLGAVSLNFLTSCMMMLFAILLVRSSHANRNATAGLSNTIEISVCLHSAALCIVVRFLSLLQGSWRPSAS